MTPQFSRGGYNFQLVKKKQVLERLGLEPFALPVLGIVSGNDYVPNVPGLAIRRNAELLKQSRTHQQTSKELLDAYVIAANAEALGYDFTVAYCCNIRLCRERLREMCISIRIGLLRMERIWG
ncbi:hypothetical protein SeLEV6574_g02517 [Synchytrium endobioticum]|uniref:Uncharacterized protein n=1 Tax=Synchytrium endobioticum TaxID=286115 RepID=A0A507DA56_9FUNG|nr:hypothetical protein SeLEV6574_g02517 [Synchytrium endobioticum]